MVVGIKKAGANLNSCGVSNEGRRHLESPGRDVADRSLDVVRDPLNEV